MKYELSISKHNVKPHIDIERDIQAKQNGLLTFNLRVNQGNIEDYATYRTVTITEYRHFQVTIQEPAVSRDPGTGSVQNAIRPDHR